MNQLQLNFLKKNNQMNLNRNHNFFSKIIPISILLISPVLIFSQVLLNADGTGNTYELINSVLAPTGGDVVENPECIHPLFGRHIAEVWDADLAQYVFEFYIHVTPDNDRCINFDRQRVEIKTYDSSPAYLKGTTGETVVYKWRFKVPTGFQPSSSFTHIHQVKAVGGDESDPLFVLTARKGTPNKLELNYYESSALSSVKFTSVNLSLFENTWAEATEQIKVLNVGGSYSITIKKVSDGTTLLSYSNNNLLTIRADNNFIRPKWGIYRSLLNSQDLRDETLRFNSFSISENSSTGLKQPLTDTDFKIDTDVKSKNISVSYSLTDSQDISISLFDLNGRLMKELIQNKNQSSGNYQYKFNCSNLKQGMYVVNFQTNSNAKNFKIIL